MVKNICILMGIMLIIGCANESKVPLEVDLNTWQDSVSYSIGADLGNTFKVRGLEYKVDSFNKGFFATINTDSSYAYGASIAANFILQGVDVNPEVLLNAFKKNGDGDTLLLSPAEMKNVLARFDQGMREAITKKQQQKLDDSKLGGETFIDKYKNEHNDEVETDSGLIYRVLSEGFGDIPTQNDKVIVHYTGKLIDGTVFDSSIDRGEPASFRVSGVIQGWQEALTMMKVGSKWELVIPSVLGYGEKSMGNIPGMSTLIFEVELLGIE